MTTHDADATALRDHYRDLVETDRRSEGIRYSATLPDGTPVLVLALARELIARVRSRDRFVAALERAASVRHDALMRPVCWGETTDGLLHCAQLRLERQEIVPGSLSAAEVAQIGARLATGLSVAHGAGVAHGAITPDRIWNTPQQGVQLSTLGLFGALCAGGVSPRDASTVMCDAVYVSPEVQNGDAPDERSDVYSLGASLYELLTGKPPFGGRTTSFVMATVLASRDVVDTTNAELNGGQHEGAIVDALLRAIEQAPDDRWPSASAFANALATRGTKASATNASRRGWSKFRAIFQDAWFPARRSRE